MNGRALPPLWRFPDRGCPTESKWGKEGSGRGGAGGHGLEWATYYAFADIHAEAACERWVGMIVNDTGKLWLNGRLVWNGGRHERIDRTQTAVFPLKLVAGRNELMLRVDDYRAADLLRRTVLRAGGASAPGGGRSRHGRRDGPRGSRRDLRSKGCCGWRGNWNGQFPDADPVIGVGPGEGNQRAVAHVRFTGPTPRR